MDQIQVTSDGPSWAAVPYSLIDNEGLSCQAMAMYVALARYANFQTGEAWPSYETLGKKAGIKSQTTVSKALQELETAGYIRKVRSQSVNHYHLTYQWGTKAPSPPEKPKESQSPGDGVRRVQEMDTNDSHRTIAIKEGGAEPLALSQRMAEMLEPYADNPLSWLRQRAEPIKGFVASDGEEAVLEAWRRAIDAGKWQFFVSDYAKWKTKTTEAKKPTTYYAPPTGERFENNEETAAFLGDLAHGLRHRQESIEQDGIDALVAQATA